MTRRLVCAKAAALGMLVALLWGWIAPVNASEEAEHRVALVIGNGRYVNAPPLANPTHDAELIAETLKQEGFDLVGGGPLLDVDRPAMEKAIREFGQQLKGGAVGLFYYSGHGIQVGGVNYLVPVSANLASDSDVKYELLDIGFVLDEMTNAGNRLNIVILDACRNNPFGRRGVRAMSAGLGQLVAPAGTVIGYATQPDSVAADGVGRNSPYTAALANAVVKPGLDLFATFNEVGLAVKQATGGQQQPWLSASPIEGRFYFAGQPSSGGELPPTAPMSTSERDALFWDSIKTSHNAADFHDYLERFPQGQFAGLAKRKLVAECDALAAAPDDPERTGPGVAPAAMDVKQAIAACQAVPDDPRSAYLLGRALDVAGRSGEAIQAYRQASQMGSAPATAALADLYDHGRGVGQDATQASRWYRIAADQGSTGAEAALGTLYEQGRGVGRDDGEAARWYRKAADQGSAPAQAALAQLYATGRGVARNDSEAARWYKAAAEQGLASAQTKLGEAYGEGVGVPRDQAEAARWFKKAAEQGDAAAQYDLGWSYQFGLGVATDRAEAARWYRQAAGQGNSRAKSALAALTGSSE